MQGEQEKLLRLQLFPVTGDLTPPRGETALHQFSIAALNDQGRQIWLPQWAKGLPTDQTVGPKVPEDLLALLTDRSVGHLPGVAAFLAQTVMGAAILSGTVVEVARGASPVAPMAVGLGASKEEVAAAAADNS